MAFTAPRDQGCRRAARRRTLYNELRNFVMSEVQRKVFAGSFDWKSILDVDTLLSQAAVAVEAFLVQFVATAEGVALSGVLTQTGDAQEVFLVKSDVIEAQAVPIGGSLWFSTYSLQNKGSLKQLQEDRLKWKVSDSSICPVYRERLQNYIKG